MDISKLNKYIDADQAKAIFDDMHQGYKEGYTTYPYKSENYYGFPQFPDNYVNYRTDISVTQTRMLLSELNTGKNFLVLMRRK